MLPLLSTSRARGVPGRPGMVIMEPDMGYMKPAPTDALTSDTWNVYPVGFPLRRGLSEMERWVLAMHTGRVPQPRLSNVRRCRLAPELHATSSAE